MSESRRNRNNKDRLNGELELHTPSTRTPGKKKSSRDTRRSSINKHKPLKKDIIAQYNFVIQRHRDVEVKYVF